MTGAPVFNIIIMTRPQISIKRFFGLSINQKGIRHGLIPTKLYPILCVCVCVCFFPTMQAACCILLNYFTQFLFFASNLLARKAVGMRCLLAGECRETCN